MKSLFIIIIMALHTRDLIAQVTPDDIKVNMKYHFFSDSESFVEICRGIVVHPKVVMTAAECVNGLLPTNIQVESSWHRVSSNVSKIIIHPEYVEDTASKNFAILIIDKIIVMRKPVACLSNWKFMNNVDLRKCSTSTITEHLHYRMNVSSDEPYWPLDCKLDDKYKENPHMFRSRQVQMVHCKPISTNSECFTYYFAHYSSNKKCLPYITNDYEIIDLEASFVDQVYSWARTEIQTHTTSLSECF